MPKMEERKFMTSNMLYKSTGYKNSFCLTPSQRDSCILGRYDGARISSTFDGSIVGMLDTGELRGAALNARFVNKNGSAYYVVKF